MEVAQYILISLATPIIYLAISTKLYMLLSRDVITRPLWSRYPKWLANLTLCSACSATWYGMGLAALNWHLNLFFLGLSGENWLTAAGIVAVMRTFTPMLAKAHIDALLYTSDVEDEDAPEVQAQDSTA